MPSNLGYILKQDNHTQLTAFWIHSSDPRRLEVEHFICERYWFSFNACLTQLPENILAVYQNDLLVAACGVQFADQKTIFSEQYMDQALCNYSVLGKPVPARHAIAEIGSMATLGRRYLPYLVEAIVFALRDVQRTLIVFTATRGLAHFLERRGIELQKLALAERSKLDLDANAEWGSYYAHQPSVFAGWTASYKLADTIPPQSLVQSFQETAHA